MWKWGGGIEVMKSLTSCDFCSCKSKSGCHEGSGFGEWEWKQQLMTVMQLRLALGFIFIAIQPSGQRIRREEGGGERVYFDGQYNCNNGYYCSLP